MNEMFETMRVRYNTFLDKFLTKEQRKELNLTSEQVQAEQEVQLEETKDDDV